MISWWRWKCAQGCQRDAVYNRYLGNSTCFVPSSCLVPCGSREANRNVVQTDLTSWHNAETFYQIANPDHERKLCLGQHWKNTYLTVTQQATVPPPPPIFLHALTAALQSHSAVLHEADDSRTGHAATAAPRLPPANAVLIILGLRRRWNVHFFLKQEDNFLCGFFDPWTLHVKSYKTNHRALRRRRALRRLLNSPAKAKLRLMDADHTGPAQGYHPS
jgi:hypothetical protein